MNINQILIIICILAFIPVISLILSTLKHTSEEKNGFIRQKFEKVSLTFSIILHIVFTISAAFLLYISISLIFESNSYISGIIGLIFSLLFFLVSCLYFRHFYFEFSRDIYFDKLNNSLIIKKNKKETKINLSSDNLKIIIYETKFGSKLFTLGKIIFDESGEKFVISDILDFTPELVQKVYNVSNKEVKINLINWI